MRTTSFLAMSAMLAANALGAAVSPPAKAASQPRTASVRTAAGPRVGLLATAARGVEGRFTGEPLREVDVFNRNTNAKASLRLYDGTGRLDRDAAMAFMRVASHTVGASDEACALDTRLVQLVFRASYHFGGAPVSIVSATRRGAKGKHGTGEAIDFALEGVKAAELAAYLRSQPLVGVGIYTHPKTQYAHLDVRSESYHWIDASPPGVSWRERRLPDAHRADRDATYDPSKDLPDTTR